MESHFDQVYIEDISTNLPLFWDWKSAFWFKWLYERYGC
jgi:hypothetical protein